MILNRRTFVKMTISRQSKENEDIASQAYRIFSGFSRFVVVNSGHLIERTRSPSLRKKGNFENIAESNPR